MVRDFYVKFVKCFWANKDALPQSCNPPRVFLFLYLFIAFICASANRL